MPGVDGPATPGSGVCRKMGLLTWAPAGIVWKASGSPLAASVLPSFSRTLCPSVGAAHGPSVGMPEAARRIIEPTDGLPPAMPAIASMPPPVVAPIQ